MPREEWAAWRSSSSSPTVTVPEGAYLVLGAEETGRQAAESSAEQVEAGKPAWADGLWQSVVDSAFPQSEPEIAPVEPEQ